jgi:hypothetical protein
MTPEKSRSLGWAAEARDADGHLMNQHAPFSDDAIMVHYIREAIDAGWTTTIWPVEIEAETSLPNPYS